jgi:hypothetical protein
MWISGDKVLKGFSARGQIAAIRARAGFYFLDMTSMVWWQMIVRVLRVLFVFIIAVGGQGIFLLQMNV